MEKGKKIVLASLACVLLVAAYLISVDTSTMALQPGSEEDPLISRSYLEKRLLGLENNGQLSDEILSLAIEEVTSTVLAQVSAASGYVYTPVNASVGQKIIGGEGTEIILRSGSALVYTEAQNGLVNITTGEELLNGANVPVNNMLIVPRGDGRGMLVTSDSWFIIKGAYTIQ